MAHSLPPLVVIGNPENRRIALFAAAAQRLALPRPLAIAYEGILASARVDLAAVVPEGALVRVESPGENAAVHAALIRRGATLQGLGQRQIADEMDAAAVHGRISGSALWYTGYCSLLHQIERALRPSGVRWMNNPADIAVLFDKTRCQAVLAERGVSVPRCLPRSLPAAGGNAPTCFEQLLAELDRLGWRRAFIKLRYGSSASGVVAFERHGRQMQATTSVELDCGAGCEAGRPRLFNSLRVRRYTDPARIATLIDELCRQQVHVEEWLPKASLAGRSFDLRIVVIAGQPRHLVMRTSRGPITNLHLGNRRGDVAGLEGKWRPRDRDAAWSTCRAAAACFPRCHYLGVDLALLAGLSRHAVLEVNAFGDLLPNVLDAAGDDSYAAELRALTMPARHNAIAVGD